MPTFQSDLSSEKVWLNRLWIGLVALSLGLFVTRTYGKAYSAPGVDFPKHWEASRLLLSGESPYLNELFLAFNYPLFVGYFYIPLAWFDLPTAELVFDTLNCTWMLLGVLAIALGMNPGRTDWGNAPVQADEVGPQLQKSLAITRRVICWAWLPLVFVIASSSQSLQRVATCGNVDGLNIMALLILATCLARRWDRLAGIALAVSILIKVAPVLFLLPVVALRRWWCLATTTISLSIYGLLLWITGLWRVEAVLYKEVLPSIAYHWQHISLSVHVTLAHTIWDWDSVTDAGYRRWILGLNIVMIFFMVAVGWLTRHQWKDRGVTLWIFVFPAYLLFVPLLELTHLAWSLGALYLGMAAWTNYRLASLPFFGWLLSWITLLHVDGYAVLYDQLIPGGVHLMALLSLFLVVIVSGWIVFFPWDPARNIGKAKTSIETGYPDEPQESGSQPVPV
jgi:hypothetical protein